MSVTKQELLSLKEENLKLKENFKKFMKNQERNKEFIVKEKVRNFMEEQETLIDNLNRKIDNFIVKKDASQHQKTVGGAVSQKRRKSDNFLLENENKAFKRPRIEPEIVKNNLENLINNPGLQHLAENIFSNLNYQDTTACQLINQSSEVIINNPRFWLKKFIQKGMSKKNQNDWLKAIQLTKNTAFAKSICMYLKRSFCLAKISDVPCYVNEDIIEKSSELINELGPLFGPSGPSSFFKEYANVEEEPKYQKYEKYIPGCIQICAAIGLNNYRALRNDLLYRKRLMQKAAEHGHLGVIKALAPLLENPNASSDEDKWTPIYIASRSGHLEIIKFLVPLANNLTSTAIDQAKYIATLYHHDQVLKYLSDLPV